MKALFFEGDSLNALSDFPLEARRAAGFELWQVQRGLMPSDWKPMLTVGQGAYEIRIKEQGEWRIIYVAKFSDGIHVLHAFQKKTKQTRKEDIDLASKRYRDLGGR